MGSLGKPGLWFVGLGWVGFTLPWAWVGLGQPFFDPGQPIGWLGIDGQIRPGRYLWPNLGSHRGTRWSQIKTWDGGSDVDMSFGAGAESGGALSGLGGGNRIDGLQC